MTNDIFANLSSKERGVGVDVELTSAIPMGNDTFIQRNFTPAEIDYCRSRPDPQASFAGKWAAKEASIKAVSSFALDKDPVWTQGSGAPLRDIEITISSSNAPQVIFHNDALRAIQKVNVTSVKVSISHSGHYAVAMAIAN